MRATDIERRTSSKDGGGLGDGCAPGTGNDIESTDDRIGWAASVVLGGDPVYGLPSFNDAMIFSMLEWHWGLSI